MLSDTHELIEEGPASIVSRTLTAPDDGSDPQWVVVKSATIRRKFSKEPHDIIKELRILKSISHINIIRPLQEFFDRSENKTLTIWEPYIPISLRTILTSPLFSPHPAPWSLINQTQKSTAPDDGALSRRRDQFEVLAKSIVTQILSALTYLHDDAHRIAHRDIKPNNILLTKEGLVQLIDFGIVWKEGEDEDAKKGDLWPEYKERMYFEVSTGQYRAPELLFGTRTYDAFAIDLWSLGATLAEFFTPLKLYSTDGEADGDEVSFDEEAGVPETMQAKDNTKGGLPPFIIPKGLSHDDLDTEWDRESLFNGMRGEIGLAWSIFKIRGTPNEVNWPGFRDLPDGDSVSFNIAPAVDLAPLLPNLPEERDASTTTQEENSHFPDGPPRPSALDMLWRLLVYLPEGRLKAKEALRHPWLLEGTPTLLPESITPKNHPHPHVVYEWRGQPLSGILGSVLRVANL